MIWCFVSIFYFRWMGTFVIHRHPADQDRGIREPARGLLLGAILLPSSGGMPLDRPMMMMMMMMTAMICS